jgi:hypothetical protein
MRDRSDRYQVQSVPIAPPTVKRLGSYLVDAGLITPAQIDVALNDQKVMGDMRLGEVLVTRGWIKQQTLDYMIQKVIEPEQQAGKQRSQPAASSPDTSRPIGRTPNFGDLRPQPSPPPIEYLRENDRKPLPSTPSPDDDVSWVG